MPNDDLYFKRIRFPGCFVDSKLLVTNFSCFTFPLSSFAICLISCYIFISSFIVSFNLFLFCIIFITIFIVFVKKVLLQSLCASSILISRPNYFFIKSVMTCFNVLVLLSSTVNCCTIMVFTFSNYSTLCFVIISSSFI